MSMLRVSARHNSARLQATLVDINTGPAAARIDIYDGQLPSTPEATTTARLVGRVTLQVPAGEIVNNALRLLPDGEGMALLTGTAGWARLVNGAGEVVCDGECTTADGAGPWRLSSLQLYAGGAVRLISAVLG